MVPILGIALVLAALSISLGNWVDRHTYIRLEDGGITFHNGLRHVHFTWEEIQRVEVSPSQWGKKVHLLGKEAHFQFRTLGEVEALGKNLGRMGFEKGEWILEHILENSNLEAKHQQEDGYYYVRD